jgi:hypothetical protein
MMSFKEKPMTKELINEYTANSVSVKMIPPIEGDVANFVEVELYRIKRHFSEDSIMVIVTPRTGNAEKGVECKFEQLFDGLKFYHKLYSAGISITKKHFQQIREYTKMVIDKYNVYIPIKEDFSQRWIFEVSKKIISRINHFSIESGFDYELGEYLVYGDRSRYGAEEFAYLLYQKTNYNSEYGYDENHRLLVVNYTLLMYIIKNEAGVNEYLKALSSKHILYQTNPYDYTIALEESSCFGPFYGIWENKFYDILSLDNFTTKIDTVTDLEKMQANA